MITPLVLLLFVGLMAGFRDSPPRFYPPPEETPPQYLVPQERRDVSWAHGFCYSGETNFCGMIIVRDSSYDIARHCADTGWLGYYAFDHGYQARLSYAAVCRNPQP